MKKINLIVILIMILSTLLFGKGIEKSNKYYDVIVSSNVLDEKSKYLDINKATLEEMSNAGISIKQSKSIIDYREKTGGFQNIKELKRIKGIGDATFKKLSGKFIVNVPAKKKPLYINEANEEDLKLYGFDKSQIKKVRNYIAKYGRIKSNLDLMKILPKSSYEKYKDIIKYDKF